MSDTKPQETPRNPEPQAPAGRQIEVCPRCAESADLALVKGCLRCLRCGFKWDCNGW